MLAVAAAGILWGTTGVATKALYELSPHADAVSVAFWRFAFAAPVLLAACRLVLGRGALRVGARDLASMVLTGALLALYHVLYYAAIALSGVSVATLVTICSAPVLVAALSAALLGERPARATLASGAAAISGTALLVAGAPAAGGAGPRAFLVGVLLALGSGAGYAAMTLLGRSFAGRHHPLKTTAVGFTSGAALLLVPTAVAGGLAGAASFPAQGWALLLFMGAVPTALAYGLFLSGMRTTTAAVASLVTLLEPLTAAFLARLFFGERLRTAGLLGALLLLGSLAALYGRGSGRRGEGRAKSGASEGG
jgi:drug/metabolite transporter, DME family